MLMDHAILSHQNAICTVHKARCWEINSWWLSSTADSTGPRPLTLMNTVGYLQITRMCMGIIIISNGALNQSEHKRLTWLNIHSIQSVGLSVSLQSVLWQNSWVDPDAVGDGQMGVLDFGGDRRREGAILGVWSPVLGFQVPTDFNGSQTTGRARCFAMTCCHLAGW